MKLIMPLLLLLAVAVRAQVPAPADAAGPPQPTAPGDSSVLTLDGLSLGLWPQWPTDSIRHERLLIRGIALTTYHHLDNLAQGLGYQPGPPANGPAGAAPASGWQARVLGASLSPFVTNGAIQVRGLGVAVGALAVAEVQGLAVAGGQVYAQKLSGLAVAGYVRSRRQHGLTVALLNRSEQLHGVQVGLLNYAGNNPRGLRWLPLLNLHR